MLYCALPEPSQLTYKSGEFANLKMRKTTRTSENLRRRSAIALLHACLLNQLADGPLQVVNAVAHFVECTGVKGVNLLLLEQNFQEQDLESVECIRTNIPNEWCTENELIRRQARTTNTESLKWETIVAFRLLRQKKKQGSDKGYSFR